MPSSPACAIGLPVFAFQIASVEYCSAHGHEEFPKFLRRPHFQWERLPKVVAMPALSLRPMTAADLDLVRVWITEPHVAKWYLSGSTIDEEIADLEKCVVGDEPTHALIVVEDGRDVGWCQWYRCADYPEHAVAVGAEHDDVGLDYALGDPTRIGQGVGTALIAALVAHIRERHRGAGLITDVEADNLASRRVLEKNGFTLQDERVVASERTDARMAIYTLRR